MGVIEQARALAAEIGKSKELLAFKAAESKVRADQNATQMVTKYMDMEQALMMKQMQGQQVSQTDITSLNNYREQIMKNQTIAAFFTAKQGFDQVWFQVNQIISSAMG